MPVIVTGNKVYDAALLAAEQALREHTFPAATILPVLI
jgi:hypothetical protein